VSATNRGSTRIAQDLYETPEWAVNLILEKIDQPRILTSLEPCMASGRIYNLLPGIKSWCELSKGVDYLSAQFDSNQFDLIITNPPFSLALPFLVKSLEEAKTVVYLLRLEFLGSAKRKSFWDQFPPSHLYVLSNRPSFTKDNGTDMTEYAWFVWDRGLFIRNPPGIYCLGFNSRKETAIDAEFWSDLLKLENEGEGE
jgi:hypothetical protein